MSEAIYFARRNFTNTYATTTQTKLNPLGWARNGAEALTRIALADAPKHDIYRQSIPAHALQAMTLGPRYGAQTGAVIADAIDKGAKGLHRKIFGEPKEPVEKAPKLKAKNAVLESICGISATLLGGTLGLLLKSTEHASAALLHAAGVLLGAGIGTLVGVPLSILYVVHIAISPEKREWLRARRTLERAQGHDLLQNLPDFVPAEAN